MSGLLALFSSRIEYEAAFPDGDPDGLTTGICGVGLVDAGIGAARLIDGYDPAIVLFAGTCGAHRSSDGLSVGDLTLVSEAGIGSGDLSRGTMRVPTLLPSTVTIDRELNERLLPYLGSGNTPQPVRCSCTLGVTEDDGLAEELSRYDRSEVENLELFSVLRAAGDRPAAAVMGITNIVGRNGGEQWRANFRSMMKLVGDMLARIAADRSFLPE
jgi:hypothetical protein